MSLREKEAHGRPATIRMQPSFLLDANHPRLSATVTRTDDDGCDHGSESWTLLDVSADSSSSISTSSRSSVVDRKFLLDNDYDSSSNTGGTNHGADADSGVGGGGGSMTTANRRRCNTVSAGLSVPAGDADWSAWQVATTFNCWLMLWSCVTSEGAYAIIALNMAQIAQAFGSESAVAFCVTLSMVSMAVGRLGCAALFQLARTRGIPCTALLGVCNATILVAMLALSSGTVFGLYLGVVFGGMVKGGIWTVIPLIMAELYGLDHLGANYKLMTVAEALGYLMVGRVLTAHIYEAHAPAGSTTCIGRDCFKDTFYYAAELLVSGMLAAAWLATATPVKPRRRA